MLNKQDNGKNSVIRSENKKSFKTIFLQYWLLMILVLLIIVFSILQPSFMSLKNIFNLIGQGSMISLLALGLTGVVVVFEFDLSFADNAALAAVLSIALVGKYGMNIFLAWFICLLVSIFISLINEVFIVRVGVPAFIQTLGMKTILIGIANWITGGSVFIFAGLPILFSSLGRSLIFNVIPSTIIPFLIGAVAIVFFLEYTYMGRYFYAVGSSVEASRRVGIDIKKVKLIAYFIMGICAGIAGIVLGSMFGIGDPNMGHAYLFPAIISTFLGGVFLRGGEPNPLGTIVAAMILAVIQNGLILLGTSLFIKEMIQGGLLVVILVVITRMQGRIAGVKVSQTLT